MKFRVRVDGSSDESVSQFVSTYSSSVVVHHVLPHGNPHYHMFVDDRMSMSIDAFRARVKRFFKVTVSSDYSVKKCDDDKVNEYVQYLFNTKHGNQSRLVCVVNFDDDVLLECKESAKEVSEDYEKRTLEREKKKKDVTIFQLAEEVRDYVEESHSDGIAAYTEAAIKVCHRHRRCCEPNMLIKIVSTARSFRDKEFLVKRVQEYFREL